MENELETPCHTRQLRSTQGWNQYPLKYATLLISHCMEIRYLNVDSLRLSFSLGVSIPMLPILRSSSLLENESLRLIAPLFQKLPNVQILRILWIQVRAPRVGVILAGNFLEDIPPPTFMLKDLHISQAKLALEQCQWVFSSSTAIDYVELKEVYDSADDLTSSIGPHVKALHMKRVMDPPRGERWFRCGYFKSSLR